MLYFVKLHLFSDILYHFSKMMIDESDVLNYQVSNREITKFLKNINACSNDLQI